MKKSILFISLISGSYLHTINAQEKKLYIES